MHEVSTTKRCSLLSPPVQFARGRVNGWRYVSGIEAWMVEGKFQVLKHERMKVCFKYWSKTGRSSHPGSEESSPHGLEGLCHFSTSALPSATYWHILLCTVRWLSPFEAGTGMCRANTPALIAALFRILPLSLNITRMYVPSDFTRFSGYLSS